MYTELFLRTVLLAFIPILLFVYIYTSWNHDYWKKRKIPYEKPLPIVGNLQFLLRRSVFDHFLDLYRRHKSEKYFGIFLSNVPVLVVQTPDLTRRILVKDFEDFPDRFLYSGHSDPLGALNLFTVKNPIWAEMRRELSVMFTSARLKMVVELMSENANELVDRIKRLHVDSQEPANLKELFSMYTTDTVGFTVFGLRTSVLRHSDSPLWFITNHMVKWNFWRGLEFSLIFFVPALAEKLKLKFFSKPASEYIKKIFWNVADKRKDGEDHSNNKDLLNLMLKLKENTKIHGEKMSDDLMLAQVAVFILGSIETSSTTLSYLLHELSHHPEEQEKLYQEITEAMKNTNKEILDYNDLMQLKYLTSCILETLRKYPPVAYMDRQCRRDYRLDERVTIRRGQPVFVNVMALHYSPELYPEPERWRPERFEGAHETDNRNFSFIPFGDGPRFCIGKRFGVIQVRVAAAQIVANYKLEKAPGPYEVPTDPYSVILAPKDGLTVKFVPRK
ncbi:Cytochrome P450 6k1 [Eumeta japonica]|uniref:unspecific monooxygenase n=1 Tax=Eumeta variegata TaxID=151549 RepID=A0A4C1WNB8_EUMVA|nr:Cytochrome P450 6k1 [Eumeta japonica]